MPIARRNGQLSAHLLATTGEPAKNEVDLKLDRVNDLWMKLEKKLLNKQPPRRIACLYESREGLGEDGDIEERRYLGIQRFTGKWRVCYAIVWSSVEEDRLPWKPIADCDVETRAHAVKGIDLLKEEVRKTRTVFIPVLDRAINALELALDDDE
jgi:hypothetical protein